MKITVKLPREIEISHVRIQAPVSYGEMPNDFPFRKGDEWDVTIDIDTGKILNWPEGRSETLHLTVNDAGTYTLLDREWKPLATRKQNYVPHGVIPGQFGDTIEITIRPDGVIAEWPKKPDVDQFFADSED